ncbi:MAG: hypothetical protein LBO69_06125 [Ignavibacteria bacterium]|jgi:hypothetical protein|nr:hypothetical protein [Ignavibacteria bacterium]
MNKENPEKYSLKLTTIHAIQLLMQQFNITQTHACRKFYHSICNKSIPCGFQIRSFQQFHQSFRKFKSLNNSQNKKKYSIEK